MSLLYIASVHRVHYDQNLTKSLKKLQNSKIDLLKHLVVVQKLRMRDY